MNDQGSVSPVIVVLAEEIDITNADAMREQLRSALTLDVAVVIADMTSTAFCDMSCFRNLLMAHDDAGASGAQLRLVIHPGAVRRALLLLGFDRLLSVYPSLDSAQDGRSARSSQIRDPAASPGYGCRASPGCAWRSRARLVAGQAHVQAGDGACRRGPSLDEIT